MKTFKQFYEQKQKGVDGKACRKGYRRMGTKKKGDKTVDNCVRIKENFKDGKKKGKSRPGRVKRAGASCNGSVASLRKRAKNSGGEKGMMFHWCANMKSGKNK